mmetsp:Transcript_61200/g.145725  ORF Transcript_61200/g.145725 Transcript_61200/m.145725 type:complete len:105 (+) Transcript_61200:108-422(+)
MVSILGTQQLCIEVTMAAVVQRVHLQTCGSLWQEPHTSCTAPPMYLMAGSAELQLLPLAQSSTLETSAGLAGTGLNEKPLRLLISSIDTPGCQSKSLPTKAYFS